MKKIEKATPTAALGVVKKIKLKFEKKFKLFFENENLNFFKYYADGFAVDVAGYAEGRATPTAHVATLREVYAEGLRRRPNVATPRAAVRRQLQPFP